MHELSKQLDRIEANQQLLARLVVQTIKLQGITIEEIDEIEDAISSPDPAAIQAATAKLKAVGDKLKAAVEANKQ